MTDIPYGLWRLTASRAELDPQEIRQRDADEAWDIRYPELAEQLDTYVGQTVSLTRAREGIPNPETGEGRTYPKGARFAVQHRVRDWFLVVRSDLPCPLLVRWDWVKVEGRT